MTKKNLYLICTILGAIIPWSVLISQYNVQEPITGMFGYLFVNAYSAGFTADLLISVMVFVFFVLFETQRLNMKNSWLFVLAILVGLSFALPLFLYFRERALQPQNT
ncbi:MAG: DUF2834 domain-containing protein [Anaerolineales bacterium]